MTEIKSAIEQLERARNTRIFFPKDISMALAIRSLNAWEEVIAQLKARRDYYEKKDYGLFVEVNACISIIESLLEGVTENENN